MGLFVAARDQWRTLAIAAAVVAAGLLAAWAEWQPQRSEDVRDQALGLVAANPRAARARAEDAVAIDPLSAQALFPLSRTQLVAGEASGLNRRNEPEPIRE